MPATDTDRSLPYGLTPGRVVLRSFDRVIPGRTADQDGFRIGQVVWLTSEQVDYDGEVFIYEKDPATDDWPNRSAYVKPESLAPVDPDAAIRSVVAQVASDFGVGIDDLSFTVRRPMPSIGTRVLVTEAAAYIGASGLGDAAACAPAEGVVVDRTPDYLPNRARVLITSGTYKGVSLWADAWSVIDG